MLLLRVPVYARVSSFTTTVYDLTGANLLPYKGIAENRLANISREGLTASSYGVRVLLNIVA